MSLLTVVVLLFVLAIVLVAIVLVLSLTRMQERKLVKTFSIEVSNRGNARSRYELWADDPMHDFRFEFLLNGARLGQAQQGSSSQPVGQNLLAGSSPQPSVRTAQSLKASAQNAGEKVSGFNQTVGGVFDTLGHLLPGGAGAAFLSLSMRMRGAQAAVDRTQRVSAQAQGLVGGRQFGSPLSGNDDHGTAGPSTSNPMLAADGNVKLQSSSMNHPQTGFIEPGKQLQLNLSMRPNSRLKTESARFKLYSKSLEIKDGEPLGQDGVALFKGMTGLMFYLPQIIVSVVALVLIITLLAVTHVLG